MHQYIIRPVLWVCMLGCCIAVARAQPVLSGKQELAGLTLYPDLREKTVFYYAPGKLRLAADKSGRPGFQLVQMRYTGTAAAGKQGEKRFLNLVQVLVWMEEIRAEQIKSAQQQLGGAKIKLKPVPLSNVEAFLVMPMGDSDGRYKKIGKSGGLEGADAKSGYWTERSFTVRLENHEAELLWNQVENGLLAISLAYAYSAEAVAGTEGEYRVSGDSDKTETLREELDPLKQLDSTASLQVFDAGAFPIEVDPNAWPDLLRKVDINDEAPPAWGVLEVRCYDFANGLRPDLGIKAIEIEAYGVTDEPVKVTGKKFLAAKPDQNTIQVRFPYAVKLTRPYRYRVIEFTQEGERREFPWISRDNWADVLDITTPPEQNQLIAREIELEPDEKLFEENGALALRVDFFLKQNGKPKTQQVAWTGNEVQPIQSIRFYADKDTPVHYAVSLKSENGWERLEEKALGTDDYIYLTKKRQ